MQHMNIVLREDGAGAQKERQPSKSIPVDQWEKLHDVFSWLNWSPPKASPCHETLRKHFPGALPDRAVTDRACAMLAEYGFDPEHTLLGTSICPDEINNEVGDISDMLRSRFGGCFPLGGISGAPFVGKTGFGAFSSHVPSDGNIFMFFGPHVAVSDTGEVGQYLRVGQAEHSSACGACIGAYKACCKLGGGQTFSGTKFDEDDLQMDWIKKALEPHTEWIQMQTNPMAALAFKSYEAVEGLMLKIVHTNFGTGKLALLGGVQINMPDPYQDHFVPQFFQIYQQGQPAIDLIQEWKRQVPFDPARLLDADQRLLQSWLYSWLAWSPPLDSPVWSIIDSQFAGAVPGQVLHARMLAALEAGPFGFTRDNTLVGTSVCPDEINNEPGDLTDLLQKHWGATFPLGGISGAPFVGKTGFKAFSSHVPDDGNVLIVFGPHVAVSDEGEVGKYLRCGQCNHSSSCGAVIGAYKYCCDTQFGDLSPTCGKREYDMQMDYIKKYMMPHAERLSKEENPMASLALQAFEMVKSGVNEIVNNDFGTGHLALVGGLQINMPDPFEDFFMPLLFEVRRAGEDTKDLLGCLK